MLQAKLGLFVGSPSPVHVTSMAMLGPEGAQWHIPEYLQRVKLGLEEKYMINVLKKVAPAIPQLRAADAAYMPATTCPLRLVKA